MFKFRRSTAKLILDILGLMYTSLKRDNLEDQIRQIANAGFDGIRFFNSKRDKVKFKDYDETYWHRFRVRLRLLKKYNLIPIISVAGYYRVCANRLTQGEWVLLYLETLRQARKVFPDDDFILEIANEPKEAPYKFEWQPKKPGMPGKMQRVGMWHQIMTDLLVRNQFPREQVIGNGIDDDRYPKEVSTAEMIIAGVAGNIFDEANPNIKNMFCSFHNILFKEDMKANTGAKRLFIARRLHRYFLTNDGGSAAGLKGHGYAVGWPIRKFGRSVNKKELYETSLYIFLLAKHGFPNHKLVIWYGDLPREYFRYKKLLPPGKLFFDLSFLDWDRLSSMPEAYKKVFGKYPKNYGKFPKPEPKPKEPELPKPEPKPEPKPKEEKMKFWGLFCYKTMLEHLTGWKRRHYIAAQIIAHIAGVILGLTIYKWLWALIRWIF